MNNRTGELYNVEGVITSIMLGALALLHLRYLAVNHFVLIVFEY